MPYASEKQRKFMHAKHPEIAAQWDKEQRRNDRKAAATGAGATTATVGLIGGGIPGTRAGRLTVDVKRAPLKNKPGTAWSAGRAGAFGYRENTHRTLTDYELSVNKHPGNTRVAHFLRARDAGKIAPEKTIIQHMRRARRASNVALVGGLGLTAYGVSRNKREKVAKAKRERRDIAVMAGGGTLAAGGAGGATLADRLGNRWSKRSMTNLEEARKIVPNLGGYEVRRGRTAVPDIKPKYNSYDIAANPKLLAGKSKAQAEAAARFHGAAAQQRHFASVYGSTGKYLRRTAVPIGLGAVALGGGHLIANRNKRDAPATKRKGPVMKSEQAGHGRKSSSEIRGGALELGTGAGLGVAVLNHKPLTNQALRLNDAIAARRTNKWTGVYGMGRKGEKVDRPAAAATPRPRAPGVTPGAARRAAKKEAFASRRRLTTHLSQVTNSRIRAERIIRVPGKFAAMGAGIAAGVPLAYHGGHRIARERDRLEKADNRHTKDWNRAFVGGGVGGAAYVGAGFAGKPYEKKLRQQIRTGGGDEDLAAKYRRIEVEHGKKMGMTGREKLGDPKYLKFYRKYPKELPGASYRRALSYTHGGKTQLIGSGLAMAATGGAAVAIGRHRDKKKAAVGKALHMVGHPDLANARYFNDDDNWSVGVKVPTGSRTHRGVALHRFKDEDMDDAWMKIPPKGRKGRKNRAQTTRSRSRAFQLETTRSELHKADPDYPYLPSNIRQDVEWGIPETRRNPVSPLEMLAAANLAASGYTEVKRHWPIGKKKRRERGMLKLGIAEQLGSGGMGLGA